MAAAGLWVKVMTTLPRSPKTAKLADDLGIPIAEAVGRLVLLWIYCVEYTQSGLITYDDLRNSFCSGSDMSPELAAEALVNCGGAVRAGFLDLLDDGDLLGGGPCYAVHDWQDYSGTFQPAYYKKTKEVNEKEKTPKSAAAAAQKANALRAARKEKAAEAVSAAAPLLRGRGKNFSSLQELFSVMATADAGNGVG